MRTCCRSRRKSVIYRFVGPCKRYITDRKVLEQEAPVHRWPLITRIAFRFCFVYLSIQLVERWWNYWNPSRLLASHYPSSLPRTPGIYELLIHRPLRAVGIDFVLRSHDQRW